MTNTSSAARTESFDYRPSAAASRSDRDVSLAAIEAMEDALSDPAPGRTAAWLGRVDKALDTLSEALGIQGSTDREVDSLMSEIATREPRLLSRIERLRMEYDDIAVSLASLRAQLGHTDEAEVEVADIRDRLSSLARRYRQHRSREADLVYEAVNVDLGGGG